MMPNTWIEAILAVFLLTNMMLAASSRLLHGIRIVAAQGLLLGILPLLLAYQHGLNGHLVAASAVNIIVKGVALPFLLMYAMRKANIKRELEPLTGYVTSILIVLVFFALSFFLASKLPVDKVGYTLAMPVSFATVLSGLFLIVSRRKALTQTIGFLTMENGIALFGTGMLLDSGLVIEFGILLDVFVLVFIMGIAILQINREFQHIDADRLNMLDEKGGEK